MGSNKKDLIELPFDQYSRQLIVQKLIDHIRPKNKKIKILDIGGYNGKTRDFFPKDKVIIVDLFDDPNDKDYYKADGTKLPFQDNEFDYSVSFDVLEHVQKNKRKKFIEEALRVSKKAVFICAPHKSVNNEYMEKSLNDSYKKLSGKYHRWLSEHIENELPDFSSLKNAFARYHPVAYFSNEVFNWFSMQTMFFTNEFNNWSAEKLIKLNRNENKKNALIFYDDENDSYRTVLGLFKDSKDSKNIASIFKKNATESTDTMKAISTLNSYYHDLISNNVEHYNAQLNLKDSELNKVKIDKKNLENELLRIKSTISWKLLNLKRNNLRK